MITIIRTFTVREGKRTEALAWLTKIVNFHNEHYGRDLRLVRNINGPQNQFHFISTQTSLAAWEEGIKEIEKDPKFQAMAAEGQGLIAEDQTVNLYEMVS